MWWHLVAVLLRVWLRLWVVLMVVLGSGILMTPRAVSTWVTNLVLCWLPPWCVLVVGSRTPEMVVMV